MSDNKKPERVGLYADEDSVIIADGAKVTGWDTAAKAKNRSTISLKGAITDSESVITNDNESNTVHKWYQKPIGIVCQQQPNTDPPQQSKSEPLTLGSIH